MAKFKKQETAFTCGVASMRNVLLSFGINHTERYLRKLANITSCGASYLQIQTTFYKLNFKTKSFYHKNRYAFKNRISRELRKGNKIILLLNHGEHWVSITNYNNKRIELIDSERNKKLRHYLTLKQLSLWGNNFDGENAYYFGIIIYQ